jgi:ATP-dependent protease HslVU (ClpYQ) peptidase subunit
LTCIVGTIDAGNVLIGGDSAAGSGGWSIITRSDQKVFRVGDFLIGFTTSFRMGQLLRYSLSPPKPRSGADVMEYMATDFVSSVRSCLTSGGWTKVDSSRESGGDFLVGYKGRLFSVYSDFQVGESLSGMAAAGCGGDFALGHLWATRCNKDARVRIIGALECAQEFSGGVRAPFYTLSTGDNDAESK